MIEAIKSKNKIHVFIVGAKSIGQYGGFEAFVDKLTEMHQNEDSIQYYISCKKNGIGFMDETKLDEVTDIKKNVDGSVTSFKYHNSNVYKIPIPTHMGSAEAIYYDITALKFFIGYCIDNHIEKPVFYVLASRIGPFIAYFKNQIHKLGGKLLLNPDGHEWKRSKWPYPVKLYWKLSERLMVKNVDLVICDSMRIEEYIKNKYSKYNPKTTYIAYGSDLLKSKLKDDDPGFINWLKANDLKTNEYYLMVGRFVPENNYETIIREFMRSNSDKDLVLITGKNTKYFNSLNDKFEFTNDKRIKFVGTVYNQELLKKIRENAFANLHGHEVGGTNPSLLEAMGSTKLNLLNDVGFNREVAEDAALYWNKEDGNLCSLIKKVEQTKSKEINDFGKKAKERIKNCYSWELIASRYLEIFLK